MEKEFSYVFNYIKKTFLMVDELKNDDLVKKLSIGLLTRMPLQFSTGNYDFCIDNYVSEEMRELNSETYKKFEILKNRIYILTKNIPSANLNDLIRHFQNYNYEDLISGMYDAFIIEKASKEKEEIEDFSYMEGYIKRYLTRNHYLFDFDGDIEELTTSICTDMVKQNIQCEDLLSGDYDHIIARYIRNNLYGISVTDEYKRMSRLVHNFVASYYVEKNKDKEEMYDETFEFTRRFISEGFNENDLISAKCDEFMENELNLNSIVKKSRRETKDKDSNRFLKNSKKVSQSIKIKPIILAAAILITASSMSACGYTPEQKEAYSVFDTYSYPKIKGECTNEFFSSIDNILEIYDEYASYGEEYAQIPIYRAYESMKTEPFHAMDTMLVFTGRRAELSNEPLKELLEYESYIEYVYDNLLAAGKIKDTDFYRKAVREYNSQVCNYKGLNPWSVTSKESRRKINIILSKYGNYIESLEKNLSKELVENERNK